MTLTQKETQLLQELKSQEQICVEKYNKYAGMACDKQLTQLFSDIAASEQTHVDTITQMQSGTVPMMTGGSAKPPSGFEASKCDEAGKKSDKYLCHDLLSMEKFVSSTYNSSLFEFNDDGMRNALNHIQTEEQHHGKALYDYMAANNMYAAQA